MQLTSTAFESDGTIPSMYTCDGAGISPELQILDVPSTAKSFVLIMDDPDALVPAGKVWDHWVVWNIPPDTTNIAEGVEPKGVAGTGSNGKSGYHPPCPPDKEHRYVFTLFALDTQLDLPTGSSKADVLHVMEGHVLEETVLIGRYDRNK